MTVTDTSYQITQGLEVLAPKSGPAYPIPCDEWYLLRDKIESLDGEPWLFQTIGSVLLGAGGSALVAVLLGAFKLPEQQTQVITAWAIVAVGAICGAACLCFANLERGVNRERAGEVAAQMDLIEKRYEAASS